MLVPGQPGADGASVDVIADGGLEAAVPVVKGGRDGLSSSAADWTPGTPRPMFCATPMEAALRQTRSPNLSPGPRG